MACGRRLDQCIFCGDEEMTEEHLIAGWVLRAFFRTRRADAHLSGTFLDGSQMQLSTAEPIDTAEVVCRLCNNEWLSLLDEAAAEVLKPLIQRRCSHVPLDSKAQEAVSAWLFKTALIFDAFESGNEGRLSTLREQFAATRTAPSGCAVFAGPAPQTPFRVDGIPAVAGLAMFGVRPIAGTLNLTINERRPDGRVIPGRPSALPIPGFLVMLGVLQAVISGRAFPLTPGSDQGFVSLWPTTTEPVTLTTVHPHTPCRSPLGSSGSTASRT